MTHKRHSAKHKNRNEDVNFLNDQLHNNVLAIEEGPKRKKWTVHDLKSIKPLTENQYLAFQYWFQNPQTHLALLGSAGCGKSFVAIYLAMNEILKNPEAYKSIKIVRSIVQTRQIGAIPGTLEEKKQPIFDVYADIFTDIFGKKTTFKDMCKVGLVELIDTSYIRGSTWSDSIIFVDEINNLNSHEVHTVFTRVGKNSRVIMAGDQKQSDLTMLSNKTDKHDYASFISIINKIESIQQVHFTVDDIVRSDFAKQWIIASQ